MNSYPSSAEFSEIETGFDADPSKSLSLRKEAYVDPAWFRVDQAEVIAKTWQWVCHIEKLRDAGSYVTVDIAEIPLQLCATATVHCALFTTSANTARINC